MERTLHERGEIGLTMAKNRTPVEYWGYSCYFCGQSVHPSRDWYPCGGVHKVKTKRNTMVYFHKDCYLKNLEESKKND